MWRTMRNGLNSAPVNTCCSAVCQEPKGLPRDFNVSWPPAHHSPLDGWLDGKWLNQK